MSQQIINIGQSANDRAGDPLRVAFEKVNENFAELYAVDTNTKYHLGDDEQFVRIELDGEGVPTGGITIQSGFDTAMPVYIKGGNASQDGVGGNVIIEAGAPPLASGLIQGGGPYAGTVGDIEMAANQVTIETLGGVTTFSSGDGTPYVTFPAVNGSQLGIQGSEISSLPGSEGLALSAREGSIILSTHGDQYPSLPWEFDRSGTINTPLLFPLSFTAVLDVAHRTVGSGTYPGPAWEFHLEWQVNPNGEIECLSDNGPLPSPVAGYANGQTFEFTEVDHGIPNYTLTIVLRDVDHNPAGYTANLDFSAPPVYPSTVYSEGAIKLTSNGYSLILDSDGTIAFPTGGRIGDISNYGPGLSTGFFDTNGITIGTAPGNDITITPEDGIGIYSNSNLWTFGSDGGLTLPLGEGIFDRVDIDSGLNIRSNEDKDTIYLYSYGTDGDGTGAGNIYINPTNVEIYSNWQNGGAGEKKWTFGSDGYLTGESLYLQGYLKGVDGSTGSTGQVLTRQSNGGVAWANATGGGGGSSDRLVASGKSVILGTNGVLSLPNGSTIADSTGTLSQGPSVNTQNISDTIGVFHGLDFTVPNGIAVGWTVNGPGVNNVSIFGLDVVNGFVQIDSGVFQVGESYTFTGPSAGTAGVGITVNNKDWTFAADASLTLPGDVNFKYGGAIFEGGHGISGRAWRTGLNIVGSNTNSTDPVRIYPAGGDGKGLGAGAINVKSDRVEIYGDNQGESAGVLWTFAHNGTLTFPSGAGFGLGDSGQLKVNDGVTLSLDMRDQSGRGFYTNGSGYTLRSNGSYSWIFDENGILNLPNSSTGEPLIQGTNSIQLNADGAFFTFGADGNLYVPNEIRSTAGVGPVTIEANDGTLRTWTFGGNGTTTLPGGLVIGNTEDRLTLNSNFEIGAYSNNTRLQPTQRDATVEIATLATGNMDPSIWTFGADGVLRMPDGNLGSDGRIDFNFEGYNWGRISSHNRQVYIQSVEDNGENPPTYGKGTILSELAVGLDVGISTNAQELGLNNWVFGIDGATTIPAPGAVTFGPIASTVGTGNGGTFHVTIANGAYSVTADYNGTGYSGVTDPMTVPGDQLGGVTPDNNLIVTFRNTVNGGWFNSVESFSGTPATINWKFNTNNKLQLPQGGDIVDSAGETVLGFAASYYSGYTVLLSYEDGHITVTGDVTTVFSSGQIIKFSTLTEDEYTVGVVAYDNINDWTTITLVEGLGGPVDGDPILFEKYNISEIYPGEGIQSTLMNNVLTLSALPQRLLNNGHQLILESDGSLAFPSNTLHTNNNLTIQTSGIPNAITAITYSSGGWDGVSGVNIPTTGGTGSGLFVDVDQDGSGYANFVSIVTAGNGYTDGDTITATRDGSSVQFTISILPAKNWTFGADGNLSAPANGTVTASKFASYTSSWDLDPDANTVNFSVPGPGTYTLWVNGTCDDGIVSYTATVVVTNGNVPVLGSQYGWYYDTGNMLVLTAMPAQITGTAGQITTGGTSVGGGNNNYTFTFGITNNRLIPVTVNYGYTRLG